MLDFVMLFCVVNHSYGSKVLRYAKANQVKGGTIFYGYGTVKNKILDFLDLNDVKKEIVIMIAERECGYTAMETIAKQLKFHKANHGIGFISKVTNFIGSKHYEYERVTNNSKRSDTMYQAIFTVVNKGMGEEVVTAAREAGARGGTIINARGSGIHETEMLFAMPIEPEKEVVMIIVPNENEEAITTSIRSALNIDEEGTGIIFSLGVENLYGINEI